MRVLVLLLLLVSSLRADDRIQKLTERLAREAEAFQKLAPQVLGRETLHQRALTPPPRHRIRIGKAAAQPLEPSWHERDIVSEYGFSTLGGQQIHELRQVTSVDGKRVADEREAQDSLAKLITASNDERKKWALAELEKYGLHGGATDFGQLLLLFSRGNLERYEFTYGGVRMQGEVRTQMFRYKQLDGPEALTVFREDQTGKTRHLNVQGEIWMREADGLPVRVTMTATDDGSDDQILREEATVEYDLSEFGAVLPVHVQHREFRAGQLVAENTFDYSDFHKFGANR
jgi:hypothetical protein